MKRASSYLGLTLAALVLASCTSEEEGQEPVGEPSASIVVFHATPQAVKVGDSVTLSWVAANALELNLTANGEPVGDAIPPGDSRLGQGTATFAPNVTTVFRLEVKGADGEIAFEEAEVQVTSLMVAAIDEFRAEPAQIPAGSSSILHWKTTDAASIAISDDQGNPVELLGASPSEGSVEVTPSVTTSYTLTAEGPDGDATSSVTITVVPAPILSVIAEPAVIAVGESSTLSWTTEGATGVTVKEGDEVLFTSTVDEELNGSWAVSPTRTTVYTVEAQGEGGLTTATAEVGVQPKIDTFFSDTLGQIRAGMLVDLIWTTTGATRLVLANEDGFSLVITGDEVASGTRKAPVGGSGVFRLTAESGDLEEEATFTFNLIDRPVILDLRIVSGPQTAGPDVPADVVLQWDVVDARSLSLVAIPGGEISLAGKAVNSDEIVVTIHGPTSFELSAENPVTTVSRQVLAEVVQVPAIGLFQAIPSRVGQGESTTLSWDVSAADRIELTRDGLPVEGVGPQDFSGTIAEQLAADTHYRLRAFNSLDYVVTQEFTVGVGTPAIENFSANRSWYPIGGEIVLSWTAQGGTSLTLTGPGGATLHSTQDLAEIGGGSIAVQAPTEVGSASYVLTLTNGAGQDTLTRTVTITDGPVIEHFEASPARLSTGDSLQFSWEVTSDAFGTAPVLSLVDGLGASYDLSGNDPLSGSASFVMTTAGSYSFTLEARTGESRFSTAVATAQVVLRPELLLAKASPEYASNEGEPIILEWQTLNADRLSLFAIGDDGVVRGDAFYTTTRDVAAGTTTFAPTIDAGHVRFVLENGLGSRIEEDLRIGVGPATIVSFKAEPTEIFRGETTKLTWETTRATSVEIQTAPYIETDEEYIDLSQRSTARQLLFSPSPSITGLLKFPTGFTFPFDGTLRKELRVANAGYISFDVLRDTGYSFNIAIPNRSNPHLHLIPYSAGDMDRSAHNGEIWWELIDADGADPHLVVQFKNTSVKNHTTAMLNYQVVLWQDGTFDFRYGSMTNPPNQDVADGSVAVIGYQNARGTDGVMVSRNTPYPGGLSNRTFHFPLIPRPIEVTATSEPFLDISGTPGAIEWTSQTANPQFFSAALVETFPDGFVFPFGGEDRRGIWIMRDGYAHFDLYDDNGRLKSTPSSRSTNIAMGVGSGILGGSSDVHLAPFWNYLVNNYGDIPGTVWTALREDGKGRFFIIQWKGFSSQDTAINQNSKLNFQILLREDGSFEYRYGNMEGGSNPRNADGTLSTIGFQEQNGIRGATISFNAPILGGLTGKAWIFNPDPTFPLSGEMELMPRAEVEYTLVARNEHSYHQSTRLVSAYAHSSLQLSTTPAAPRPNQAFSIDWHATGITSLSIEDEDGTVIHYVQGTTFDLRRGSFLFPAGLDRGVHRFTVRALGYLGDSATEEIEILVFPPFSIDEFTSSVEQIRLGEKTRLSWRTTGVSALSLASDVVGPIEISTLNMVSDSLELEPTQTTTYTLTATSEGRTTSKTLVVEVRTISIEEFNTSRSESGNNVIRGTPVTVSWNTLGSGSVYWRNDNSNSGSPDQYFAYDVSDEAKYEDIEGSGGLVERISASDKAETVTVAIPFFFGLYDDEPVASIRVSSYGAISSRTGDSMSATTTRFPDYSNTDTASNQNGRIAIFWDDLHPDNVGKMHTKHIHNPTGVDQFIIQWKGMKINASASNRNGSLNFQLVLFEDQTFEFRYGKMSGTADDAIPATEAFALRSLGSMASIGFRSAEVFGLGQQLSYRKPVHNGGLSNRSLRFVRSTVPFSGTGSVKLAPLHSTDYKMCATSDTWSECESFRVAVPEPGDLMITELQIDPLGTNPIQWFEVRNLTLDPIDMEGMTLVVGSHTVPINTGRPLILPPASYGVFSSATSTSFDSLFVYGAGIDLKAETSIEIRSGNTVMARAAWQPSWFAVRAASLSVDTSMQRVGTVSVPDLSSWCESPMTAMYDEANAGTPGTHGETCLSLYYDVDYLSDRPFIDISDIGVRMPEMVARFKNEIVPIGNGFTFPFFDQLVMADVMWSGSWGTISFGPYLRAGVSAEDSKTLSTQVPGNSNRVSESGLIAGSWAATQPRADGTTGYFAQRVVVDGFEVFITQWNRYSRFYVQGRDGDLIGSSTHQIQIWENGDIVIAFDEIIGYRFNGTDSVIGLVNPDGSSYLQYFYREPLLKPHQSILYRKK